jgi:hypothetical protein
VIKSPCKNCENHKEFFPKCFEKCEILNKIRNIEIEKEEKLEIDDDIKSNLQYDIREDLSIMLTQNRSRR